MFSTVLCTKGVQKKPKIHSFNKYQWQIYANNCARHWGYSSEKNKVPELIKQLCQLVTSVKKENKTE